MAEPQTSPFRVFAAAAAVVTGVLLLAVLFGALGGSEDESTSTEETVLPVETEPEPEPGPTEPPPASDPPATGTDPAVALERIVDLEGPSAVADPPGAGPVLVSTLDGRVHAVDLDAPELDATASEVVLDLSDQVSVGGERGLLGLATDPEGTRLYVNYTDTDGDTNIRSWPLADGRPQGGAGDGVVHLELGQPYANHNGGHLAFGPDGLLWIGTGDGGSSGDPDDVAQDPSKLLGKMLRVAPDPAGGLTAPATNPDWGGQPEIWGIGLRNPWRYSFDRETDQLWIADVGQNTTEEVSVVAPDAAMPNFGWDDMEGDRPFEGEPDPAFISPAFTYGHDQGCSITGGYVYRGDEIESLRGWYLYGDFCGGYVRAVPADDPAADPTQLVGDAGPVLSFGELEDGELVVLTQTGIHRVAPA